MDKLQIVNVSSESRIDSRLIAQSLGIDHQNLMQTIEKYESRIKALGISLFQTDKLSNSGSGGRPAKFCLLNENQAIFIATLSRNTDQVVDFKLALTIAFSEARKESQKDEYGLNNLWSQRLRLFNDHTKIPVTHWCIFNEIAHVFWGMEFKGVKMSEYAVPDISVGKLWMKQVRVLKLDEGYVLKYPHFYPDKRGKQWANLYPNAWLGDFRNWFHTQYLQREFKEYLLKHSKQIMLP